jgi:hypothetical protein
MTFLYDIYLTRQILIPAASLIRLIRELIGNPDGFQNSLGTHEARGRSLGSESANCGSLKHDCGRTNGFSVWRSREVALGLRGIIIWFVQSIQL